MVELKRNLNDECHEKEAVTKSAEELRATVKKNEGDKIELNRALADSRQKCASEYCQQSFLTLYSIKTPFDAFEKSCI